MYHNDLPDMSEALRQVYEKKQLDSVGAEDKDIDNDGDHDKTDSYLLNRRKKVSKAMGKKTHICAKPGTINNRAATAIAAPETISYVGGSFLLIWTNPDLRVFKPSYFA